MSILHFRFAFFRRWYCFLSAGQRRRRRSVSVKISSALVGSIGSSSSEEESVSSICGSIKPCVTFLNFADHHISRSATRHVPNVLSRSIGLGNRTVKDAIELPGYASVEALETKFIVKVFSAGSFFKFLKILSVLIRKIGRLFYLLFHEKQRGKLKDCLF